MTDDQIADHVLGITQAIYAHQTQHRAWWAEWRHNTSRIICGGCGCLCWPWESCPGCRARRQEAKQCHGRT